MSTSKSSKKWKDKFVKDLLESSKTTKDHVTIPNNLNDIPMHRELVYEKTIHRISKIEKKNCKSSSKNEVESENLDVLPDKSQLTAEIDKNVRHLRGQKKFLQIAKEFKHKKTWGERLSANQETCNHKKCPQKCDATDRFCTFLQKLMEKNHVKVADSCTQIESPIKQKKPIEEETQNFAQYVHMTRDYSPDNVELRPGISRRTFLKLVNSGTQVGSSVKDSKQPSSKKEQIHLHQSTSLESRMERKDSVGLSSRYDYRSRSKNRRESDEEFGTNYNISYKPYIDPTCVVEKSESRLKKEVKAQTINPQSPAFLSEKQRPDLNLKLQSSKTFNKVPLRSRRLDSAEKDLNKMSYIPFELSDEIEDSRKLKSRRRIQKTPRSKVCSRKNVPPIKVERPQVRHAILPDSTRSLQSDGQEILYSVKDGQVKQRNPRQTYKASEQSTEVDQLRQKIQTHNTYKTLKHLRIDSQVNMSSRTRSMETHQVSQTASKQSFTQSYKASKKEQVRNTIYPTNNLSAASNSMPLSSFNVIRHNVIDDNTYILPGNDKCEDYIILPYVYRSNGEELSARRREGSSKLERTSSYFDIREKLPISGVGKSVVAMKDVSSQESRVNASIPFSSYRYETKAESNQSPFGHQFEIQDVSLKSESVIEPEINASISATSVQENASVSTRPHARKIQDKFSNPKPYQSPFGDHFDMKGMVLKSVLEPKSHASMSTLDPQKNASISPQMHQVNDMSYKPESRNALKSTQLYEYEEVEEETPSEKKASRREPRPKRQINASDSMSPRSHHEIVEDEVLSSRKIASESLNQDSRPESQMNALVSTLSHLNKVEDKSIKHISNQSQQKRAAMSHTSYLSGIVDESNKSELMRDPQVNVPISIRSHPYKQNDIDDSFESHQFELNYTYYESEPSFEPHENGSISPRSKSEMKDISNKPESIHKRRINASTPDQFETLKTSETEIFKTFSVKNEAKDNSKSEFFQMEPKAGSDINIHNSSVKEERKLKAYAKQSDNDFEISNAKSDLSLPLTTKIDSRLAETRQEGTFLSDTQSKRVYIEGINPEVQDFIHNLQNRLKDCDESVRKQLMKHEQELKERCPNVKVCRLTPRSLHNGGDRDGEEDRLPISVKTEIELEKESSLNLEEEEVDEEELPLDSDQISESKEELEMSCHCCRCGEEQSTSVSDQSEIPPFAGCECMKEGYYKIMHLAYNT